MWLNRSKAMGATSRIIASFSFAGFVLCGTLATADDIKPSREELEKLLPALDATQMDDLLSTGSLSRAFRAGDDLLLVPDTGQAGNIAADLQSVDFTVGVEVLKVIPDAHSAYSTADLMTLLLQVSTLAGVEYYSESKGRMRTLFEASSVIDNPATKQPIPDPVVSTVPDSGIITVLQVDTTFGENINTITYEVTDSTIHMLTTNDTTFSWGFVPIIRTEKLRSHLLIVRADSYMLYYANFGANALQVRFFESRIHDSFYNRLIALQDWFEAKLED